MHNLQREKIQHSRQHNRNGVDEAIEVEVRVIQEEDAMLTTTLCRRRQRW